MNLELKMPTPLPSEGGEGDCSTIKTVPGFADALSFLTGETLRVTLKNTNVQISCLEIRERSVLVKVQGEQTPRELKLQAWQ